MVSQLTLLLEHRQKVGVKDGATLELLDDASLDIKINYNIIGCKT